MTCRRFRAGLRPESSLCLIFAYAFFILLSPSGRDALPKGAKLRYGAYAPVSQPGAVSNAAASSPSAAASLAEDGIWIDDEQDACHSSPVNRKADDAAPFALIDSESSVRKGAATAPPLPSPFPYAAAIAFRPAPAGASAAACYLGPALPFSERFPVFLISALPPPLPA